MDIAQWFADIINRLINIVVWPVFVAVVVIMFIWAGFLFLTSQGDTGKVATARKAIIWAVVGVLVGITAFSIVTTVQNIIPVFSP